MGLKKRFDLKQKNGAICEWIAQLGANQIS